MILSFYFGPINSCLYFTSIPHPLKHFSLHNTEKGGGAVAQSGKECALLASLELTMV